MSDPDDLLSAAALGSRLLAHLSHLRAMDSIVPGTQVNWGLQVGDRVFGCTIRIVTSDGVQS